MEGGCPSPGLPSRPKRPRRPSGVFSSATNFIPLVHSRFGVASPSLQSGALTLTEVRDAPAPAGAGTRFSLLFDTSRVKRFRQDRLLSGRIWLTGQDAVMRGGAYGHDMGTTNDSAAEVVARLHAARIRALEVASSLTAEEVADPGFRDYFAGTASHLDEHCADLVRLADGARRGGMRGRTSGPLR